MIMIRGEITMKKKIIFSGILAAIIVAIGLSKFAFKNDIKETKGVEVVPTMEDTIVKDSSWCPTFQLIFNDLKNNLVKQDVKFSTSNSFLDNLNKEEFTESDISSDYYYKTYGVKSIELKNKIIKGIKDKFNQESDILDRFDFTNSSPNNYFFYSMLYREFKYPKKFNKLAKGKFNDKYDNIKYFGIKDRDEELASEIKVLYYNSEDDFAIKLLTTSNDEVIINKNPKGNNFKEIYNNITSKSKDYKDNEFVVDNDYFKMPYLNFNVLKEYKELEGQPIKDSNGDSIEIDTAIQTIKFSLDDVGGKIKSEAGMDTTKASIGINREERYFYVDETFAIFLKEASKDKPYFAARVDDIRKFQ